MRTFLLITLSLIIVAGALLPGTVIFATENIGDPLVPCGRSGTEACELCDIFVLINNVFNFVITKIVPALATIFVVIGGFYILTAGGNQEKVSKGRKILINAAVGLLIVYASFIIVSTILGKLSENAGGFFRFERGVITIGCSR